MPEATIWGAGRTPFGKMVDHFCVDYDISRKKLAQLAGLNPYTLDAVVKGQRSGSKVDVAGKVVAAMEEYKSTHKKEEYP